MVTKYPAQIDSIITLPSALDNVTPVAGSVTNRLRDAIIRIEMELGVKPSGIYSTIRHRLDELEASVSHVGGAGAVIALGGATPGQTVIWNGINWIPGTDFRDRNLSTTGSITSGPIEATQVDTGLFQLSGKFIANGITTSLVSSPGQGIIYYDSVSNHFLVSENGGPYILLGSGSGGGGFIPGGDIGGSSVSQTVIGLRNHPVSSTAPTLNQALIYNGTAWAPANVAITFNQDVSGNLTAQTVVGLQTRPIANTAPATGQALLWDGSSWSPSTNFQAQNIQTSGSIVTGPANTSSLTTGLQTLNGKLIINSIPTSASLSDPAQAILYYDTTSNKIKISENGSVYTDLVPIVPSITVTTVTSSPYNILSTDSLLSVTAGNVLILEATPAVGRLITVKDTAGSAGTSSLTVNGNGKMIDGAATYVIATNYGEVQLVYTGTMWSII